MFNDFEGNDATDSEYKGRPQRNVTYQFTCSNFEFL